MPTRLAGSGALLRMSRAGELMAPPASTKWRAVMVTLTPLGRRPSAPSATALSPVARLPENSSWLARSRESSVAPLPSAAGMVVTSIDCLALVGQPVPQ